MLDKDFLDFTVSGKVLKHKHVCTPLRCGTMNSAKGYSPLSSVLWFLWIKMGYSLGTVAHAVETYIIVKSETPSLLLFLHFLERWRWCGPPLVLRLWLSGWLKPLADRLPAWRAGRSWCVFVQSLSCGHANLIRRNTALLMSKDNHVEVGWYRLLACCVIITGAVFENMIALDGVIWHLMLV